MDSTPSISAGSTSRQGVWTGRTLAGKYRVGDLIGEGGLSQVYRAIQLDLDREVAVKVLGESADADARARFLRETKIAAGIRHPCVAQIFDAGVDESGQRYLAMELLEGETLADRLRRGPIAPADAVAVVASLCLALQAVHDKGFLHRDVKPSNIFLAQRLDGSADPKLIDFGIAKRVAVTDDARRRMTTMRGLGGLGGPATSLDIIVGTPLYLSPEQIRGDAIDGRSDVYALAVTLYEMLAGAPPFHDGELTAVLTKIVVEDPAPLADTAPEGAVPPALDREVCRALSKDPALRPASAADFAAALWGALAEARHTPDPAVPAPRRDGGRIVAALAVAAALAVVVVAFVRRSPPPPPPPAIASATAAAPVPAPPGATASPPATASGDARSAGLPLRPTAHGSPSARAGSAPAPARTVAPEATAAPSEGSFRVDDLKPSPF